MSRETYAPKEMVTGDGSNAVYTFSFKIEDLSQLLVVEVDQYGVETQRVRGDDTSYLSAITPVTFDSVNGGGTVTLAAYLGDQRELYFILANDEPTQPYEFRNKSSFTLKRIEAALDWLAGAIQRLTYKGKQAIKLNDQDDEETFDTNLPVLVASKILGVNAAGTGLQLYTQSEAGVTGDVNGPVSSIDNALVRYDGTTGKIVQGSSVVIDDSDNVTGIASLAADSVVIDGTAITSFKDEDDMVSDSATAVASQQSIKKFVEDSTYVDSYRINFKYVTAVNTLAATDSMIIVNGFSGVFATTLPPLSSVGNGKLITLQRSDASGGNCTVLLDGSDVFAGYLTCTLTNAFDQVTFVADTTYGYWIPITDIGGVMA